MPLPIDYDPTIERALALHVREWAASHDHMEPSVFFTYLMNMTFRLCYGWLGAHAKETLHEAVDLADTIYTDTSTLQ